MRRVLLGSVALLLVWTGVTPAQNVRRVNAGARLGATPATVHVGPEDSRAPVLRQLISLRLEQASLEEALTAITKQVSGRLMFEDVPDSIDRRVTVEEEAISVRDALDLVLQGTGLEVVVPETGSLVLVKQRPVPVAPPEQDTAKIHGRVIDASSGDPVAAASVSIRGTTRQVVTDGAGRFTLSELSAGEHTLVIERLGYQTATIPVFLRAGQDTSIVVRLSVQPVTLNAIVTTGTGERKRREIGNSTVTLRADSIMAITPVHSVSQLLADRVPGLFVTTNSGAVGAPSRLRMRGISSIESDNEPIIIVDGVRLANSTKTSINNTLYAGVYGGTRQAGADDIFRRLDDIDPNSIESIEVLKGPAASTMYGSEAANGVIIIKTKRGQAGPPRWNFFADYRTLAQVEDYEYPIEQVGYRLTGGATSISCRIMDQWQGLCIPIEGEYRGFNMLKDPRFTPQARGYSREVGANVSGGTAELQYYIGGFYQDQLGTTKMPEVNRVWIENARGDKIKEELIRPNALKKMGLEARVTGRVGTTSDFALSAKFSVGDQRVGPNGMAGLLSTPRLPTDTTPVLTGWESWYGQRQISVKHIMGSASWDWRPTWWNNAFSANISYGWDFSLTDDEFYAPRGSCQPLCVASNEQGILGYAAKGRRTDVTQNLHVGTSLRVPIAPWLTSYTRFGGNFTKQRYYDLYGNARDLRVGVKLYAASGTKHVSDLGDTRATAGWYLEEQFNLRQDRLFFTFGMRQDAGSSFGETVKPIYPKFNASWMISEEPFFPFKDQVPVFRVRAATGQAGVMPATTARRRTYAMGNNFVLDDGSPTGFFAELGSPGDPELRAERSREYEGGFDLEFFDRRLALEFTYYYKFTKDAIHRFPTAGSVGPSVGRAFFGNVGDVENYGFELWGSAQVIEMPSFSYRVTGSMASRNNKLVRMADGVVTFQSLNASGDLYTGNHVRLAEGYPLFGRWAYPILDWADRNGDGLIDPYEVKVSDSLQFVGPSEPKYTATIGHEIGLFNNRIAVHANFAYVSGMTQFNDARKSMATYAPAQQGMKRDLREQACVVAAYTPNTNVRRATDWCFMETFDLLRFRDLSVSYALPASWLRPLGASSANILFTVNNLTHWTNYKGRDPLVNTSPVTGNAVIAGPAFGAPREYGVRLRVHF